MLDNEITLEELAQRSGVEQRTLRSWISQDLLLPPNRIGRGARYPGRNVDRALAVRTLKEVHGEALATIRKRLMLASDSQIREWAKQARKSNISLESPREYLRRIKEEENHFHDNEKKLHSPEVKYSKRMSSRIAFSRRNQEIKQEMDDVAGVERLISILESILARPVPRKSRGKNWTRISITPDIEISIRGKLEPRDRALFEQLADLFRSILSGRIYHDDDQT